MRTPSLPTVTYLPLVNRLMALLDEILTWTETALSLWQRDAARRLVQNQNGLSDEDYTELYALLKAAHGLPNPLRVLPQPLAAQHLPATLQSGEVVILKSMRDLKNVNRIPQGQKLEFAPVGMTVIYGGNGAGKSGYGRAMKRACRARDQVEKVHPDANDPQAATRIPEATFEIEINGTPKSVRWIANTVPPDELSTIAVFDCHCARAYLTTEQDVAYLPYGLDVVENLANKVLPELTRRLDLEIAGIEVNAQPFAHLLGDTQVGRLVASVSDKTDPSKIKTLGTLSDQEMRRLSELDSALAEADPTARAKQLRLSADRVKALLARIEAAMAWVSDAAITKLNTIDDALVAAHQAEKVAADCLRSGESLLPGTGEQTWKSLFDAARKFSTDCAYPAETFPYTGENAVCPLCQSPLDHASERLQRFEKYIKDDVAKAATQQREHIETVKRKIEHANLSVGLDEALTDELASLDHAVAATVLAFQTALQSRREWMLNALSTHKWDDPPILCDNPRRRLRDVVAGQLRAARTFDKAADKTRGAALKAQRDELRARHNLSLCLDALLSLIDRMKTKRLLESCKKQLKTRPISDKSKDLATSAVTNALKTALDKEFASLGIGHIGTKLKDRNDKGKIKLKLLLDLPTTNKLEEILSEGEQRAIALGSFLAELQLANHSGGIVFDDPVSSLDHWRRQNVARRLVEEAARRQVIVLTHDTSFLGQLRDEIEEKKAPSLVQFLECKDTVPGYVSDGLPWEHKNWDERINALEKVQKALAARPWPPYPGEQDRMLMRSHYSNLRATIERVVQDIVLNGVVKTYRDYIQLKLLKNVVGFEKAEQEEIQRLYQRCHRIVEAHDPSSAKNASVPTPSDLGTDLRDLRAVIDTIRDRRKNAAKPATATP
jgi:energy-coupling factor transporter ATP-binding protein EcfA2